ncbi:hypothetical protein GpartN1_g6834.t1 [Galdieria partita]|uniref:Uncharacterized protein n=1 Tax=Galdieria partita TaxID=83374 RepID=A0A9C7Q217_9RHOD|nr:hypothetical protein GpartN1_g6834.t1 [Galdieria partita]
MQDSSSTALFKAFKTSRFHCWKLWESCSRKANLKRPSSTSLVELGEEIFEFLGILVTLTRLLRNIRRRNDYLTRKLSGSLRKMEFLRIQRNKFESKIRELILLSNSSVLESLKLQPPWKMLCSLQVEEMYGPRIAGMVTRTLQTEYQAWELETLLNRFNSYWLCKHLQRSQFCLFIPIQKRQCSVYVLANTLYSIRKISISQTTLLLENIQFRLKLKKQDIAMCENNPVKTDEYALGAALTFSVKGDTRIWNVSIEEDLCSELSLECPHCSHGSFTSSNEYPLFRIEVEPNIPLEKIRILQHLLLSFSMEDISERISIVTSELSNVFVVSETKSETTSGS